MFNERNAKKENSSLGFYLACFFFMLILLVAAVLLLPVWRDYRRKETELVKLRAELAQLKAERNEKWQSVHSLQNSPDAVEKVARERFNLVRPGDRVLEYQQPGRSGQK